MALLYIPPRPPTDQVRLNSKNLQDVVKARRARYTQAKDAILGTKRLRETMQDWLASKGMFLDPAVQTDDVQLQQLMLYWHLCEPWVQDKIALMRPVFHLEIPQIRDEYKTAAETLTAELKAHPDRAARIYADSKRLIDNERAFLTISQAPGGANSLNLMDDGTVSNVIVFSKNKAFRFFKPVGLDVSSKENILYSGKMLPNEEYDGGFATVYHRYDLADLVAGESDSPVNLYSLFFFAHEMTHALQNCFAPICGPEARMVDSFTRFRLLANQQERVPLYRRWVRTDASTNPDTLSVFSRPLRGANPLDHHTEPDTVFAYLAGAVLRLPPDARVGQLAVRCGLAVTNGTIDPLEFVKLMFADIKRVIGPLITSQIPEGEPPEHCFALSSSVSFGADYRRLAEYLSVSMNDHVADAALPALGGQAAVGYPVRLGPDAGVPSLLDAVLRMINAAINNGLTLGNASRLCVQIQGIQQAGFKALRNAVEVWNVKVARSVAMQRQASRLFPNLIGAFTDYSNGLFSRTVRATRIHLSDLIVKHGVFAAGDADRQRWELLPVGVRNEILAIPGVNAIANAADVEARVSSLQLYALGAPLGIFNVYTQEWDAEAYAMWTCCPEEFEAMYKRVESEWPKPWEQIWNMVTYASKRGIEETEGNAVPNYRDRYVGLMATTPHYVAFPSGLRYG